MNENLKIDMNSILLKNNMIFNIEEKSILSADDLNYYKKEKKGKKSTFCKKYERIFKKNQENKFYERKKKNFSKKKIFEILKKFFEIKFDKNLNDLSENEKKILLIIILLKYPELKHLIINLREKNIYQIDEIFTEIFKIIPEIKFNKKNEEINKFIYKFTIKCLKKKFFEINILKNSQNKKKDFFNFYFKKICQKYNKKIEDFFDPLNFKGKKTTLNNHFFHNNFLSQKFKQDFTQFLNTEFVKLYKKVIFKKLEKFFNKYSKELNNIVKDFDLSENSFNFKIKRIHFPWTLKEVDIAIFKFKKKFLN